LALDDLEWYYSVEKDRLDLPESREDLGRWAGWLRGCDGWGRRVAAALRKHMRMQRELQDRTAWSTRIYGAIGMSLDPPLSPLLVVHMTLSCSGCACVSHLR
jgi:hypothetical protein